MKTQCKECKGTGEVEKHLFIPVISSRNFGCVTTEPYREGSGEERAELGEMFAKFCYSNVHWEFMEAFLVEYKKLKATNVRGGQE